jgi:hypothetical protein
MLQTPLWKRILIWATVALGVVLAAPNLFYTQVEGIMMPPRRWRRRALPR